MSWSPHQQAMLSAMGYTLYRPAGASGSDATAVAVREDVPLAPGRGGGRAAGPDREPLAGRLGQALLRAAGGDLAGVALPPLSQLRGDAAAKRALWPTLRALRRSR